MLRSTYPFFLSALVVWPVVSVANSSPKLQIMKSELQMAKKPNEQNPLAKIPSSTDGVESRVTPQPVIRDQRVLDAAKMYEKYFLGQMMKAMRSTVHRSELQPQSMGEGIYREQLDDQYVDTWGERGGIGLAEMIHDELIGKAEMLKQRRLAMKAAKGKTRTPMALTDRDVLKVRKLPAVKSDAAGENTMETVLVSLGRTTARPEDGPESVRSPWAGAITKLDSKDGKVVIGLEVGTEPRVDRKVEIAFDGVTFQVNLGDVVKAGQVVGHLGKSARGILLRQTLVQDVKAN